MAGYSYTNIDTLNQTISNRSYLGNGQNGGWLTTLASGGWIKPFIPTIVGIGNSIMAGHGSTSSGNIPDSSGLETGNLNHPQKRACTIGWMIDSLTQIPFLNKGVGSTTSTPIRARFYRDVLGIAGYWVNDSWDVVGGIPATLPHKPLICVIEGFSNDLDTLNEGYVPFIQTKKNVLWMVQQCAINNIYCVVLNCVGIGPGISRVQGSGRVRGAGAGSAEAPLTHP